MTSADHHTNGSDGSTRDRLVAEGLRAFTTRGFDGASLREIERSAGVGRGLVAHHFGTKDGLWRECVNWLMGRYRRELEDVRDHLADVSPLERARVLLRVHVRFVARNPEYTRLLMLSGADDSDRVRWMIDTWIAPSYAFFRRLTAEGASGSEDRAFGVYAISGAASLMFTLPVEAREVFGVNTADPDTIERFADLIVGWAGYESAGDGQITSAIERARDATTPAPPDPTMESRP